MWASAQASPQRCQWYLMRTKIVSVVTTAAYDTGKHPGQCLDHPSAFTWSMRVRKVASAIAILGIASSVVLQWVMLFFLWPQKSFWLHQCLLECPCRREMRGLNSDAEWIWRLEDNTGMVRYNRKLHHWFLVVFPSPDDVMRLILSAFLIVSLASDERWASASSRSSKPRFGVRIFHQTKHPKGISFKKTLDINWGASSSDIWGQYLFLICWLMNCFNLFFKLGKYVMSHTYSSHMGDFLMLQVDRRKKKINHPIKTNPKICATRWPTFTPPEKNLHLLQRQQEDEAQWWRHEAHIKPTTNMSHEKRQTTFHSILVVY